MKLVMLLSAVAPFTPAPANPVQIVPVSATKNIVVPASENSAENPFEKLVCHHEDNIGSRIQKRLECHTASEWRTMHREAEDTVDWRIRIPHLEH